MFWSCHYDCHDMEPNVHGNLSSTCWFVSLEVGTKNIAKLHILMCADVYPMVALKCLLRIKRYQIPHKTQFLLASFGCTSNEIPSKNFTLSSILTPQCFHMLRFIFMWTFMSSYSRVQTTHAVRLPSHLFLSIGDWVGWVGRVFTPVDGHSSMLSWGLPVCLSILSTLWLASRKITWGIGLTRYTLQPNLAAACFCHFKHFGKRSVVRSIVRPSLEEVSSYGLIVGKGHKPAVPPLWTPATHGHQQNFLVSSSLTKKS